MGFMFVAYNLRRLLNSIDKKVFIKFLQELVLLLNAKKTAVKAIIIQLSDTFLSTHSCQIFYRLAKSLPNLIILEIKRRFLDELTLGVIFHILNVREIDIELCNFMMI